MRKIATLSSLYLASLLALPVAAADKPAAAEKKPSATLEAPLITGYEAAKPFFRPSGTAPAVYGPGDLYSMLVTGKESNNVFSNLKPSFLRAADLLPIYTAERMKLFTS